MRNKFQNIFQRTWKTILLICFDFNGSKGGIFFFIMNAKVVSFFWLSIILYNLITAALQSSTVLYSLNKCLLLWLNAKHLGIVQFKLYAALYASKVLLNLYFLIVLVHLRVRQMSFHKYHALLLMVFHFFFL